MSQRLLTTFLQVRLRYQCPPKCEARIRPILEGPSRQSSKDDWADSRACAVSRHARYCSNTLHFMVRGRRLCRGTTVTVRFDGGSRVLRCCTSRNKIHKGGRPGMAEDASYGIYLLHVPVAVLKIHALTSQFPTIQPVVLWGSPSSSHSPARPPSVGSRQGCT